MAVGYLSMRAPRGDRILSVSSPSARAVEIHESSNDNGISRMKRLETLNLPAGQPVVFEPGGRHLMIFGAREIGRSATIPITITLESGGNLLVNLPCRQETG